MTKLWMIVLFFYIYADACASRVKKQVVAKTSQSFLSQLPQGRQACGDINLNPINPNCSADLTIILDFSTAMLVSTNIQALGNFVVNQFVPAFQISPFNVEIAVEVFGTYGVTNSVYFESYEDICNYIHAQMENSDQLGMTNAMLSDVLTKYYDDLLEAGREGFPQNLVLFTAINDPTNINNSLEVANQIKDAGVNIIVIGMNQPNNSALSQISTNYYQVADFYPYANTINWVSNNVCPSNNSGVQSTGEGGQPSTQTETMSTMIYAPIIYPFGNINSSENTATGAPTQNVENQTNMGTAEVLMTTTQMETSTEHITNDNQTIIGMLLTTMESLVTSIGGTTNETLETSFEGLVNETVTQSSMGTSVEGASTEIQTTGITEEILSNATQMGTSSGEIVNEYQTTMGILTTVENRVTSTGGTANETLATSFEGLVNETVTQSSLIFSTAYMLTQTVSNNVNYTSNSNAEIFTTPILSTIENTSSENETLNSNAKNPSTLEGTSGENGTLSSNTGLPTSPSTLMVLGSTNENDTTSTGLSSNTLTTIEGNNENETSNSSSDFSTTPALPVPGNTNNGNGTNATTGVSATPAPLTTVEGSSENETVNSSNDFLTTPVLTALGNINNENETNATPEILSTPALLTATLEENSENGTSNSNSTLPSTLTNLEGNSSENEISNINEEFSTTSFALTTLESTNITNGTLSSNDGYPMTPSTLSNLENTSEDGILNSTTTLTVEGINSENATSNSNSGLSTTPSILLTSIEDISNENGTSESTGTPLMLTNLGNTNYENSTAQGLATNGGGAETTEIYSIAGNENSTATQSGSENFGVTTNSVINSGVGLLNVATTPTAINNNTNLNEAYPETSASTSNDSSPTTVRGFMANSILINSNNSTAPSSIGLSTPLANGNTNSLNSTPMESFENSTGSPTPSSNEIEDSSIFTPSNSFPESNSINNENYVSTSQVSVTTDAMVSETSMPTGQTNTPNIFPIVYNGQSSTGNTSIVAENEDPPTTNATMATENGDPPAATTTNVATSPASIENLSSDPTTNVGSTNESQQLTTTVSQIQSTLNTKNFVNIKSSLSTINKVKASPHQSAGNDPPPTTVDPIIIETTTLDNPSTFSLVPEQNWTGTPCAMNSQNAWLDIVIVAEVSNAMTETALNGLGASIADLVLFFNLNQTQIHSTRFALITFNSYAVVQFGYTTYKDQASLIEAFMSLDTYMTNDPVANMAKALNATNNLVYSQRSHRRPVVILAASTYAPEYGDPQPMAKLMSDSNIFIATLNYAPDNLIATDGLGRIANAYMNFSDEGDVQSKLAYAMLSANCMCELGKQEVQYYVVDPDHKNITYYADCYMGYRSGVAPGLAQESCQNINGFLVTEFSDNQDNFITENVVLSCDLIEDVQIGYTIGLHSDSTNSWLWYGPGNTEIELSNGNYENWCDSSYLNAPANSCVYSSYTNGSFCWMPSQRCEDGSFALPYVCQFRSCDTDHFKPGCAWNKEA